MAKAWSAFSYILLISTFKLHGKKGDVANIILKRAFIFKMSGGDNFFNVFAGARITKPLFCSMNMLPNWSAFLSLDSTSYKWRCQLMYSMKIRVLIILQWVKSAPLVVIGLTVWQKYWGRAKAWPAISYILLIYTFSLQGKKGDAANIIFKCAFIFKASNLLSKPPWLRQG